MDAFSGTTSQPTFGSLAAALADTDRDPGFDPKVIREISFYWEAVRTQYRAFESDLRSGWEKAKMKSRLAWEDAKDAVRDAWDRDDRTYRTYEATDRYYGERFANTDHDPKYDYDTDYRPAYRYGTYARGQYGERDWDDTVESDLERGWERAKGTSRMAWNEAKSAVKEAWHSAERVIPGDFDRDGR